jgi:hypothetical protein
MKTCGICKEVKDFINFGKDKRTLDGLYYACKKCKNDISKKHYLNNRDAINERHKLYNIKNKEKIKEYNETIKDKKKLYNENYNFINKDKLKDYHKKYRLKNKDKKREYFKIYYKQKRKEDSMFKFKCNVRNIVYRSFKKTNSKFSKTLKSEEILGCNFLEFKDYIKSQFTKGMTLENYGEWHLDHIVPIATAKTEEDVIRLNHYTNFQPLWAEDNQVKGAKIITKQLNLL